MSDGGNRNGWDMFMRRAFLAFGLCFLVGSAWAQVSPGGGGSSGSTTVTPGGTWTPKILAALVATPATVKASSGTLGPTHCDNGNGSTVYVEYFNTATPMLGSTPPIWFVPIPTGGGGEMMGQPIGIGGFTVGIYAVAVTGYNGTTAVGTPLNCAIGYN